MKWYILGVALLIARTAYGASDCMDSSWHLLKRYDSKVEHHVACQCSCKTVLTERFTCTQCGHIRYYRPATESKGTLALSGQSLIAQYQ